jgi:hypothetical protein
MQYIIRGMGGLQGPFYGGTNTFHRRNAIYGLYPDELQYGRKGYLFIAYLHFYYFILPPRQTVNYNMLE